MLSFYLFNMQSELYADFFIEIIYMNIEILMKLVMEKLLKVF